MGVLRRRQYPKGWVPSADSENCPPDALLRMDNLILDDLGILSLRKGALKINQVALGDLDVHSLYTALIAGTKSRFWAAGNKIYKDGLLIVSGVDQEVGLGGMSIDEFDVGVDSSIGLFVNRMRFASFGFSPEAVDTLDVAFGQNAGNVLMARGTTKKRNNGVDTLDWGLDAPGGAPTVSPISLNTRRATFAPYVYQSATPAVADDGSVGWANISLESGASARPYVQFYGLNIGSAGPLDLSSGGLGQGSHDVFQFSLVLKPSLVTKITLAFGVNNDGSTANGLSNTMGRDNYSYTWTVGDPNTPIGLTSDELTAQVLANGGTTEDVESIKSSLARVSDAANKELTLHATGIPDVSDQRF